MDALKVQAQIRQNAEEVSGYVSDLVSWETNMKKRDHDIRSSKQKRAARAPPRVGGGNVQVVSKTESAAKHTYDVGYKKWEKFDEQEEYTNAASGVGAMKEFQTPASIVQHGLPAVAPAAAVPRARGVVNTQDTETMERERGNDEFKNGNFTAAVKQYTKCLGMKAKNYVAFSNRAMAYLKLKEFAKAEMDCDCALSIQPGHVKSLQRRATARIALGKHRAAVGDLMEAEALEPTNKALKADLVKARELLRNTVNRAPLIDIQIGADGDILEGGISQGPDLPTLGQKDVELVGAENNRDDFNDIVYHAPESAATRIAIEDNEDLHIDDKSVVTESIEKKDPQKKKRNKLTSKDSARSAVVGGYDLERYLRTYRSHSSQMESYLETLKIQDVPKMLKSLMDGDVIALLLIELSAYLGEKHHRWSDVLDWFGAISEQSSFGLLVSLVTEDDKRQLKAALQKARDMDIALERRIDELCAMYRL